MNERTYILGHEFTDVLNLDRNRDIDGGLYAVTLICNGNKNNEKSVIELYMDSVSIIDEEDNINEIYTKTTEYVEITVVLKYEKERPIMNKKKTFRIKLDTEFTIDFESYDCSDEQLRKVEEFKRLILNEYFDACMYEDVDVTEKKPIELFESMAELFRPKD